MKHLLLLIFLCVCTTLVAQKEVPYYGADGGEKGIYQFDRNSYPVEHVCYRKKQFDSAILTIDDDSIEKEVKIDFLNNKVVYESEGQVKMITGLVVREVKYKKSEEVFRLLAGKNNLQYYKILTDGRGIKLVKRYAVKKSYNTYSYIADAGSKTVEYKLRKQLGVYDVKNKEVYDLPKSKRAFQELLVSLGYVSSMDIKRYRRTNEKMLVKFFNQPEFDD